MAAAASLAASADSFVQHNATANTMLDLQRTTTSASTVGISYEHAHLPSPTANDVTDPLSDNLLDSVAANPCPAMIALPRSRVVSAASTITTVSAGGTCDAVFAATARGRGRDADESGGHGSASTDPEEEDPQSGEQISESGVVTAEDGYVMITEEVFARPYSAIKKSITANSRATKASKASNNTNASKGSIVSLRDGIKSIKASIFGTSNQNLQRCVLTEAESTLGTGLMVHTEKELPAVSQITAGYICDERETTAADSSAVSIKSKPADDCVTARRGLFNFRSAGPSVVPSATASLNSTSINSTNTAPPHGFNRPILGRSSTASSFSSLASFMTGRSQDDGPKWDDLRKELPRDPNVYTKFPRFEAGKVEGMENARRRRRVFDEFGDEIRDGSGDGQEGYQNRGKWFWERWRRGRE